jgi:protein-tyrosine-phosphatase
MAAALLTARARGSVEARSAAIDPEPSLNPFAVEALHDAGLDVAKVQPRRFSAEELAVSRVIWLGARVPVELESYDVECWDVSQSPVHDLPAGRRLREELERRIDQLLAR